MLWDSPDNEHDSKESGNDCCGKNRSREFGYDNAFFLIIFIRTLHKDVIGQKRTFRKRWINNLKCHGLSAFIIATITIVHPIPCNMMYAALHRCNQLHLQGIP